MASNDGSCRFADWLLKVCAGEKKGYGVCFCFLVVVFFGGGIFFIIYLLSVSYITEKCSRDFSTVKFKFNAALRPQRPY